MYVLGSRLRNVEHDISNSNVIDLLVSKMESDMRGLNEDYDSAGQFKKAWLIEKYNHGYLKNIGVSVVDRSTRCPGEWKGLERDVTEIEFKDCIKPDNCFKDRMYELADEMMQFPKEREEPGRFYKVCAKLWGLISKKGL